MKILIAAPLHISRFSYVGSNLDRQQLEKQIQYDMFRSAQHKEYKWKKAFEELGHEVLIHAYNESTASSRLVYHAANLERMRLLGSTRIRAFVDRKHVKEAQARLVAFAKHYSPGLILLSEATKYIDLWLVTQLKNETQAQVVFMIGVSPIAKVSPKIQNAAPYFDFIFCNDFYHSVQWLELGAKQAKALPITGCDPDSHVPQELSPSERQQLGCDVCFVGRFTPANLYSERFEIVESLGEFDLGIWSDSEEFVHSNPKLAPFYKGRAWGEDLPKVLSAAKIVINSHGQTMQWGGNMRTFETPAIGAFQLIDRYDPTWFEEGKEIVSFKNAEDLREKISYYLTHDKERVAIAAAGQQRALRDHTYTQRMARLIDLVSK